MEVAERTTESVTTRASARRNPWARPVGSFGNPISMTTPTTPPSHTTKPFPWLLIAVDALQPLAGSTVSLETLYAAIATHPHARFRDQLNDDVRCGIKRAIWRLQQAELLLPRARDRWKVDGELGA